MVAAVLAQLDCSRLGQTGQLGLGVSFSTDTAALLA